MTETNEVTPEKNAEVKAATPIIRGRMPVAIVALARFGENKGMATKEMATLFGTTVGKIDDIKKNRNFAYVGPTFVPTAEQKAAGIEWLKRHPEYDKQNVDKLVNELESMPDATPEQAGEFEAARVAARGQNTKTKDGEPANAGGGNRRGKNKKKDEEVAEEPADGDELLS